MSNQRQFIIPDSLAVHPHLFAFDVVMRELVEEIEVDKILCYLFDTVDAELLPVLAEQFDLMGVKGWDYATNEKAQRQLLKNAIRLKRYKGTQWAVEEAIKVVGYDVFEYQENVGDNWGTFRIRININDHSITTAQVANAAKLVDVYKRKSAWFEGFFFHGLRFEDDVTLDDDLSVNGATNFSDNISTTKEILRNGTILRDGTQNYSTETDTLRIRIV